MSILSKLPDDLGYYYGFIEGDSRQVNVRYEERVSGAGDDVELNFGWFAYVGGEEVDKRPTKDEAEAAAIAWTKNNPEEE